MDRHVNFSFYTLNNMLKVNLDNIFRQHINKYIYLIKQ